MRKRIVATACLLATGLAGALWLRAAEAPKTEPAPGPASGTASKPAAGGAKFVIADCTAFKDNKLTVKFRMDEDFDRYVSAPFAYPHAEAKGAEAGKTYVFTFKGDEAAHTVQGIKPVDEKDPPKDLNDHQMIGKVAAITEKAVIVEFVKDDNLKRFYSREQIFTLWNPRAFSAGQVLKITFGDDNRHCKGYAVIEDK